MAYEFTLVCIQYARDKHATALHTALSWTYEFKRLRVAPWVRILRVYDLTRAEASPGEAREAVRRGGVEAWRHEGYAD